MAGLPAGGIRKAHAAKMGGNMRVSMNIKATDDPAIFDWSEKGNVARHMTEPLVRIGEDGVAQPYLAESWSASEDLKTWTFNLRKNATWSNGDTFGADDVIHNFRRWLDPATGSSNQGRFSSMTTTTDTGKKDDNGNTPSCRPPKQAVRLKKSTITPCTSTSTMRIWRYPRAWPITRR